MTVKRVLSHGSEATPKCNNAARSRIRETDCRGSQGHRSAADAPHGPYGPGVPRAGRWNLARGLVIRTLESVRGRAPFADRHIAS